MARPDLVFLRFPAHPKKRTLVDGAVSLTLGSHRTCGDAAARLKRNRTRSMLPDDASQPEADMICAAATPEAFRSEGRRAVVRCTCERNLAKT